MPYDSNSSVLSVFSERALSCPECESTKVVTEVVDHRFAYGQEDSAVELSARIPVRRCEECGDEFLDDEAEDLMHEAICRHLRVMTPSEVRAIRGQSGTLSRAEFARVTRLGEATIGRWERGQLIQNAAYDQFLHLLTFPENVIRLRQRLEEAEAAVTSGGATGTTRRFRVLHVTDALEEKAVSFLLNTGGAA
jgi:putative zinc finger/helix-turn-helix YgiT family protein